jgi:hypothetical protein
MKILICCACLLVIARPIAPNTDPWIDALPFDYPKKSEIIAEYLKKARQANGLSATSSLYEPPNYPMYRYATSLFLNDLRKQGWRAEAIEALRLRMANHEQTYKTHGKYPW